MIRILNLCLIAEIQFHDTLHGFLMGRGTGTASLEANIIQHMMVMRKEVLYEIFLDLHKAYDALYHGECLDILVEYGVGPRAIRLLRRYWDHLTMVTRYGGYFGDPFKGQSGVTQGGPLPPQY